jgi:hypothetical protein
MPIRSDCIRRPANPVPKSYVPPNCEPYKVKDGEGWISIAQKAGAAAQMSIDPWYLIRLNFPGLPESKSEAAKEVNWYLQEYVGCKKLTADQKNYCFSTSDYPGTIYVPKVGAPAEPAVPGEEIPIVQDIAKRRESIMANTPARFIVAENPNVKAAPNPWYALKDYEEVTANVDRIERLAARYGVDPDIVKAIVWLESTHGYYDRVKGEKNDTLRPMNIHHGLWAQLGIDRATMKDPEYNIAAGIHIWVALWDRVVDPTVEKVGSVYNMLGATQVIVYGKTLDQYYRTRPWLHIGK